MVCDTSKRKFVAAPAAATTTTNLALRDQSIKTKACTICGRPSQCILGLAEDRLATSGGDAAEVEVRKAGPEKGRTRVDKLPNSASDSCTSTLEDAKGGTNPQNRRLLKGRNGFNNCSCLDMSTGIGVVRVDAGREGSQGARPKRRPTTKRRRAPQDDHVQSAARASVKTTVNVPKSPSRTPSAVGAVARQIGSSSTETQATGTSMIPQNLDIILIKKAVPNPDLEPTDAISDIAVVPRSCFLEKRKSARRKDKHSILEGSAMRLHQPTIFTPSPRALRNKQDRRRQGKTKDSQDKDISVDIEFSKKNSEGVTESHKEVQDPIATYLARTQTTRTPDSDTKAGLDRTIVLEGPNKQGQANPDAVNGKRLSRSMLQRLKRKQKEKADVMSEKMFDVNNSGIDDALARSERVYWPNISSLYPSSSIFRLPSSVYLASLLTMNTNTDIMQITFQNYSQLNLHRLHTFTNDAQ